MTRETKIGMLVGLAFIIVIGILLSDHMTSTTETPAANQARAGSDVRGGTTTPAPATPTSPMVIPPPSIATKPMPTEQELAAARQQATPAPTGPAVQNIQVGPGGTPAPPTSIAIQGSTPPPVAIGPGGQTQAPQPPIVITQPPANSGPVVLAQPDSPTPEEALNRWAGGNNHPAPPAAPEPKRSGNAGVPMAAVKQYKAEPGDNLHKMALKTMGVSTKETREAILNANPSLKANPDKIIVGRTYVIPPAGTATSAAPATPAPTSPVAAKPAPAPSRPGGPIEVSTVEELNAAMQKVLSGEHSAPAPKSSDTTGNDGYRWYTVKENDTLWGIAAENLGAGSKLTLIQDLNKELLKDKVTVHPGQKLRLPPKEVASAGQ